MGRWSKFDVERFLFSGHDFNSPVEDNDGSRKRVRNVNVLDVMENEFVEVDVLHAGARPFSPSSRKRERTSIESRGQGPGSWIAADKAESVMAGEPPPRRRQLNGHSWRSCRQHTVPDSERNQGTFPALGISYVGDQGLKSDESELSPFSSVEGSLSLSRHGDFDVPHPDEKSMGSISTMDSSSTTLSIVFCAALGWGNAESRHTTLESDTQLQLARSRDASMEATANADHLSKVELCAMQPLPSMVDECCHGSLSRQNPDKNHIVDTISKGHKTPHPPVAPVPPPACEIKAVLQVLHSRLARLRENNRAGRPEEVISEAEEIARAATSAGWSRLASSATRVAEMCRIGFGKVPRCCYVLRDVVDMVELHLDTAEALWSFNCSAESSEL